MKTASRPRIEPLLLLAAVIVTSCAGTSEPPRTSMTTAESPRTQSSKGVKPVGSAGTVAVDGDGSPLAASASASVATSVAPTPPQKRDVVVLDPTQRPDSPLGSKIAKAEEKRVLDLAFGKGKYLTDYKGCPAKVGGNVESRRARGYFAPSVVQSIAGAFTKAGAAETLAYVCNSECNSQGSVSFQVVVLEGDAVKANVNLPTSWMGIGWSTIEAVFDLDGDGRSEFIRTVTSSYQGERTAADVMRLNGDKLETIQSFSLLSNACPWATTIDYSIVHVVQEPGAAPVLNFESKTKACP